MTAIMVFALLGQVVPLAPPNGGTVTPACTLVVESIPGADLYNLALRAFVWVIWVHLHDGSAFRFAPGSSSAPSTVDILRPEARTLAAG